MPLHEPGDLYANDHEWLPEYREEDHQQWARYWEVKAASRQRDTDEMMAKAEREGFTKAMPWVVLMAGVTALTLLIPTPSADDDLVCEGRGTYDAYAANVPTLSSVLDHVYARGVTTENRDEVLELMGDINGLEPDVLLEDRDFPITYVTDCR